MDEGRGGLLSAGGILSIIVGAFEVIGGAMMLSLVILEIPLRPWLFPFLRDMPGAWYEWSIAVFPILAIIVMGVVLLVLGIIAIAGGISAIRRQSFGLSLAGGICALIPFNLLGLLSVIFVSLGKREF
jgi:hypothetical protein